ncbi:hypothetical protein PHOSAC3_120488 [Mesotoga infera]|nr:hypothetical protein PHOSAC3_120488 [Mesotoga infera]
MFGDSDYFASTSAGDQGAESVIANLISFVLPMIRFFRSR